MTRQRSTRQRLIDAGLRMLLEQGYGNLGIQAVLDATNVPKGSFYHHFEDKEDFALKVIDAYIGGVHAVLDECVQDRQRAPIDRVRRFFELTRKSYKKDGYMGCLMGGLGQELSGVNAVFRARIEGCFTSIADRLALCLEDARRHGDLPAGRDTGRLANLLVDCWEGAALRSRLRRDPAPLTAMLDFYLRSIAVPNVTPPRSGVRRRGR